MRPGRAHRQNKPPNARLRPGPRTPTTASQHSTRHRQPAASTRQRQRQHNHSEMIGARRPRGVLGTPHRHPPRPERRDVLRLLPTSDHDRSATSTALRCPNSPGACTSPHCQHDPPAQRSCPSLARMHQHGITIGDLLVDSGYAYRQPETFALPIRRLGAEPDHRPAPQRPRHPRHPPRRDLPQRQPLLPRHARPPARHSPRSRAAPAPSRPTAHDQPLRRARPLQALTDSPATTPTATAA